MNQTQKASVIFYGLSTCVHCKKTHEFLDENGICHETYWVDEKQGEERAELLRKVKAVNPRISFPTLVFEGGEVVIGEDQEALKKALGKLSYRDKHREKEEKVRPLIVKDLMEKLAPLQKKQGYIFNPYETLAEDLLEQLLQCKETFGYMCCPCRLASGNREHDSDIICPCEYRSLDVQEYGVCFCGLYVLEDTSQCPKKGLSVPDRRPPEKVR